MARDRRWLHTLLFALTFLSTLGVGARLAYNFEMNRPAFIEEDVLGILPMFLDPAQLLHGAPYAVTLMLILLAHEMGHYLACRFYGIGASLPYFLPAPTLIGTFGAFIRIRTAIFSKVQLFDVGVAGPIAGFVFILPAIGIGLAYSKVLPGIVQQGDYAFGTPLILRACEMLVFPGVPSGDLLLHPIARAAWVGLLSTALNLLPIGQLDGGHILYAMFGEYHRIVTRLLIVALVPLGLFYYTGWLVWAALLLLFARRHPRVYDEQPLPPGRRRLGLLAFIILVISFSVAPVQAVSQ